MEDTFDNPSKNVCQKVGNLSFNFRECYYLFSTDTTFPQTFLWTNIAHFWETCQKFLLPKVWKIWLKFRNWHLMFLFPRTKILKCSSGPAKCSFGSSIETSIWHQTHSRADAHRIWHQPRSCPIDINNTWHQPLSRIAVQSTSAIFDTTHTMLK